jgi:hypothetical protein
MFPVAPATAIRMERIVISPLSLALDADRLGASRAGTDIQAAVPEPERPGLFHRPIHVVVHQVVTVDTGSGFR